VGDGVTASSLGEARKAVALVKLGAADPACTVLTAGIGVREGQDFRLVQTARIERKADETAVAELELASGEYHVVSYVCTRPRNGAVLLAQPSGSGLYRKSYASFQIAAGEVLNVGYLQLVPMGATRVAAHSSVLHVRLAVTDWPLAEIERYRKQRPGLYAQMKTRLMTVARVEPPTLAQVRAACAEMKRLQAQGKVQHLPAVCELAAGAAPRDRLGPPGAVQPGGAPPPALQKRPGPAKKDIGV
jgi:hypothetical protein